MMTDIRKYIRAVNVFLIMLVLGAFTIHIFLSNYISLLSSVINILVIGIILLILFSTIITYFIFDEKEVSKYLMNPSRARPAEWRDCRDLNTGCRSAWRRRRGPRRRHARNRRAIRPPRARLRPAGMEARASAYRSHRSRNSDSTRCGTPRRAEYPRHAPPRLRSRRSSHRIPRRFRAE